MSAKWIMSVTAALAVISAVSAVGASPEQGSFEEKTDNYSWAVQPDPVLPNVLILGDSISIGYTLQVRQLLQGKANVYRPLAGATPENCGDTVKAVGTIDRWLAIAQKWDVIHFNWGLHDLKRVSGENTGPEIPSKVSVEDYKKNLQTVIGKMKTTGAKLIFATTTAYPAGVTPCRIPEDAETYNAAALEVMTQNGIPIDDLYAFTSDQLEKLQVPRNVHFTPKGSQQIARQVADSILKELDEGK